MHNDAKRGQLRMQRKDENVKREQMIKCLIVEELNKETVLEKVLQDGIPNLDWHAETTLALYVIWSFEYDRFLRGAITYNETWSFQYHLETQHQSIQWKEKHTYLAHNSRPCLCFSLIIKGQFSTSS